MFLVLSPDVDSSYGWVFCTSAWRSHLSMLKMMAINNFQSSAVMNSGLWPFLCLSWYAHAEISLAYITSIGIACSITGCANVAVLQGNQVSLQSCDTHQLGMTPTVPILLTSYFCWLTDVQGSLIHTPWCRWDQPHVSSSVNCLPCLFYRVAYIFLVFIYMF